MTTKLQRSIAGAVLAAALASGLASTLPSPTVLGAPNVSGVTPQGPQTVVQKSVSLGMKGLGGTTPDGTIVVHGPEKAK